MGLDGPARSTGRRAGRPACKRPVSVRQSVLPMVTDRRTREDDLVGMIFRFRILVTILTALIATGGAGQAVASGGDGELAPGTEERQQIERGLRELTRRLGILRKGEGRGAEVRPDRLAE